MICHDFCACNAVFFVSESAIYPMIVYQFVLNVFASYILQLRVQLERICLAFRDFVYVLNFHSVHTHVQACLALAKLG